MIKADYIKYPLHFIVPAGTSRGTLHSKDSWFILLSDTEMPEIIGVGECTLIPGLSYDDRDDFEKMLDEVCKFINNSTSPDDIPLHEFPSIRYGLETAYTDLKTGGKRMLFPSEFSKGKAGISINGLIWMSGKEEMLQQIQRKISQGFRIIKLKVGALNFEDELDLLGIIRERYAQYDLEIRLDANGAWKPNDAITKIERLSDYNIHSIEQPIKKGQWEEMAHLCKHSPVKIALDEELIGISDNDEKQALLEAIKPDYLIIKPGLLGGFSASEEWIDRAESMGIGWWITSALESNIGLNAIAQWIGMKKSSLPQGLGTGKLFSNNIPSPLMLKGDKIWHIPGKHWDLSALKI